MSYEPWSPLSSLNGVTVRISEKYKPPPPISVPSGLFESVSAISESVGSADYDFALETNVLAKLGEWRSRRRAEITERNHRLQLREEARQRQLDLIAATQTEERLKQLSVSEVSYPSADEISEPSEDDGTATPDGPEPSPVVPEDGCPNILQPIQLSNGTPHRVDLLDDLDPIKRFQQSVKIKSAKFTNLGKHYKNVDNLNFSDFENDTSSPFDNMELKTINDIELLAQVLNAQSSSNPTDGSFSVPNFHNATASSMYTTNRDTYPAGVYGSPVQYPVANQETPYPPINPNVMNGYDYHANGVNNYYGYSAPSAYQPTYHTGVSESATAYGISNGYVYDAVTPYVRDSYEYFPPYPNVEKDDSSGASQPLSKTRSKSVPDIVKELDDELVKARQRTRERSHNCSPAPAVKVPDASAVQPLPPPVEKLSNPFDDLSPRLKFICQFINGMGFPLDRVARACEKIGDDDKKIIEFLLSMDKLMDLGFRESSVADALLRHDCNREKALDALIS